MARSASTYWWVVAVSSWPSQSAMTVMSTPDCSRCIAVVCLRVWGEIGRVGEGGAWCSDAFLQRHTQLRCSTPERDSRFAGCD